MSRLRLYKWIAWLLLAVACSTAERAEYESSRNNQRRLSLRHHDDVASFSRETEEGSLWDDGLLMSSSGSRKDKKINDRSNDDDDDKKTLSQQVKEGKYGLIQNEIFATEPKRPGIVSYTSNSDMPTDTVKNFGGLDEDEIWLAENHVLVLRGGSLPEGENQNAIAEEKWPPIDNFQAPNRPVKIPSRPKVPPPFPVQLTEGGPIKILGGGNKESQDAMNVTFSKGFLPGEGPFFPLISNNSAPFMPALSFVPVNSSKGTLQFKPIVIPDKQIKVKPQEKSEEAPVTQIYPALPPGAVIVPPPANRTDYDDEEDQSIYYPPPYSFVYEIKNNSSGVPPGPLVPGIILPPPPDFFSLLDEEKKSPIKDRYKQTSVPTVDSPKTTTGFNSVPRKPSTKYYKTVSTTITSAPKTTTSKIKTSTSRSSTVSRYSAKTSLRKPINSTVFVPRPVFVEVTTPTPTTLKSTTYEIEAVVGNQVSETSTEKNAWTAVVSSKSVPLLATIYATTTPSPSKEQQIETTPSSGRQTTRLPEQASFYFYGEPNNEAGGSVGHGGENVFFTPTTTESPTNFYKVEELSQKPEDQYYNRVEEPQTPQRPTAIKLLESLVKDPRVYKYSQTSSKDHGSVQTNLGNSLYASTISSDRSRNPYLTGNSEHSSNVFYQDPQVGIKFDYDQQKGKPRPIYQYSFEAADYNKDRKINKKKKQQSEREVTYQYPEREIIPTVRQTPYDPLRYQYKPHTPIEYYGTTTVRSPVDVSTTLEPHRVYITKQDEQLLDDVTKEYFTMFGKKLTGKRVQSTTPIYKTSGVTEKPKYYTTTSYNDGGRYKVPKVKVHYGGLSSISRPFSLQGDTLVNYKHPLPQIDPDSEFITVIGPHTRTGKVISQPIVQEEFQARQILQSDNQVRDFGGQHILQQTQQQNQNDFIPMEPARGLGSKSGSYASRPVSLANDEAVNYQNPRPPVNPDAEYVNPIPGQPINRYRNKANSYFAYNLPGDGGHFYFLTPQAIPQRQNSPGTYLYSNPRASRLVRRRRGPAT